MNEVKCPKCNRPLERVSFYFVCHNPDCRIRPYGWEACFTLQDVVLDYKDTPSKEYQDYLNGISDPRD